MNLEILMKWQAFYKPASHAQKTHMTSIMSQDRKKKCFPCQKYFLVKHNAQTGLLNLLTYLPTYLGNLDIKQIVE